MNKVMKAITTIMIVILLITLIWVFLAYYRGNTLPVFLSGDSNSDVSALNIPNNNTSTSGNEGIIDSIIKDNLQEIDNKPNKSGDTISGDSGDVSGDVIDNNQTDNSSGETIPNTIIDIPTEQNPEDVVISSNTETSDVDKQKVLSEIDDALQKLLETVGKVQTVDESKLDASLNSEVIAP